MSSNADVSFYLNGQKVGSIAGTQSAKISNAYWFLGSLDGSREFYSGDLDDVQIYHGWLSDVQVGLLYSQPGRKIEAPSWSHYGQGTAGTLGVPQLDPKNLPMVDESFRFTISNSAGTQTNSALIFGVKKAAIPLFAGTVLVDPSSSFAIALTLPVSGLPYQLPVPNDPRLNGVEFFMQVIEIDAGAPSSFAFSPGLELRIGG